jgi:hypothetical protein
MPGWASSSLPKTSCASTALQNRPGQKNAFFSLLLPAAPPTPIGRLYVLVWLINVGHGENGKVPVVAGIAERDADTLLQSQLVDGGLRDVEGDGHGEEDAIGEAALLYHPAQARRQLEGNCVLLAGATYLL